MFKIATLSFYGHQQIFVANVNHTEIIVSFDANHSSSLFDSDYRRKGFILVEGKEDGNRGSRSSTSCLMCIAARAERRHTSTRHDTDR